MEKKFTEKIISEQNKKLKRDSNKFLSTFLIIFIAGYTFFFTSTIWMPDDYTGVKANRMGETTVLDDRELTPVLWEYCEDQNMMRVIAEINDMSAEGKQKYKWTAADRKRGNMPVKVVLEREDIVQIFIKARSFTEVSLRMSFDDEKEPLKIYATKKSITRTKSIRSFSEKECRLTACEAHIDFSHEEISNLEKKNKRREKKIMYSEETIKDLKNEEEYQTEQEIDETESKISDIQVNIDQMRQEISDNDELIKELEEKINMLTKKKKEIEGDSYGGS